MFGIRSFFRDLSFEQHPRPGRELGNQKLRSLEPEIKTFSITGWGYTIAIASAKFTLFVACVLCVHAIQHTLKRYPMSPESGVAHPYELHDVTPACY